MNLERETQLFTKKVLIFLSLAALFSAVIALFFYTAELLLLLFASAFLAIIFHSIGKWLAIAFHIKEKPAVIIAIIFIFLISVLAIFYIAPIIINQTQQLSESLPESIEYINERLSGLPWIKSLIDLHKQSFLSRIPSLIGKSASILTSFVGLLGGLILVFVIAAFFAIEPELYIRGLLRFIPGNKRQRVKQVFIEIAVSLRWWMVGILVDMVIVMLLTIAGLLLLDVSLAILLGVIAGVLVFIPTLGPIIGAIPAVLVASVQGPQKAFFVIILFITIQLFESNLLVPVIMQKSVRLPPALILTGQLLFAIVFGFMGLLLAIPLLASVAILIRSLYIEDMLKNND